MKDERAEKVMAICTGRTVAICYSGKQPNHEILEEPGHVCNKAGSQLTAREDARKDSYASKVGCKDSRQDTETRKNNFHAQELEGKGGCSGQSSIGAQEAAGDGG